MSHVSTNKYYLSGYVTARGITVESQVLLYSKSISGEMVSFSRDVYTWISVFSPIEQIASSVIPVSTNIEGRRKA